MRTELSLVDRFFHVLVEEIRESHPEYLRTPFTVAEIYQSIVPYRTHRDRIGAEMNGDYEDALLRLLGGEGDYMELDSDTARERIRLELRSPNPNTGLYREYAAVQIRLNPEKAEAVPESETESDSSGGQTELEVEAADSGDDQGDLDDLSDRAFDDTEEASGGEDERAPRPGVQVARVPEDIPESAMKNDLPASCPDCGESLPDRDTLRFCPLCGVNVLVMPCGSCGEVLERGWNYCLACGTPVE